jgi:hypothetical protein
MISRLAARSVGKAPLSRFMSSTPREHTLPPVPGLLTCTIPSGREALVLSPWGTERVVTGPRSISRIGSSIRMFRHFIIPSGEKVVVWDQRGQETAIDGPASANVHPDGDIFFCPRLVLDADQQSVLSDQKGETKLLVGPGVFHLKPRERCEDVRLVRLASNEAVCVIRRDGLREVVRGSSQPRLFLDPREKLHQFVLTGGGDQDGLNKKPGALKFEVLRLQPSQSYYAFPVRTSDNTVLIVKLMIFQNLVHPERFVLRDDPLAVMFNFIMAETTAMAGGLSFDDFKHRPDQRISEHFAPNANSRPPLEFLCEEYGLLVDRVVLRGWEAQDPTVQRILDQAGAAQTQRDVERANHALRLEQLQHQREQLELAELNFPLEQRAAEAQGTRSGASSATTSRPRRSSPTSSTRARGRSIPAGCIPRAITFSVQRCL